MHSFIVDTPQGPVLCTFDNLHDMVTAWGKYVMRGWNVHSAKSE